MAASRKNRRRFVISLRMACMGLAWALGAGNALAQAAAPAALPAGETAAIEFGYPEQPPRVFTNAQGKPEGQAIRMATALFAKAGIPWRAASYPASRLFNNLENGTTNFSVLVRNPALLNCCLFNKVPLYSTELNLYYIGDKAPVRSRNELVGKHIITIRGYSYSGLINFINDPQNRIVNEVAATHEAAFKMLVAGRADYVLNYSSSASVALAEHPVAQLNHDTIEQIHTYIVLSKNYPNAEKVMSQLEDILKEINAPAFFMAPEK